MPEETLRDLLGRHGFSISGLTYRLTDDGRKFEYRMTIRTVDEANFTRLARSLAALPSVLEFDLSPPATRKRQATGGSRRQANLENAVRDEPALRQAQGERDVALRAARGVHGQ